MMSLTHRSVVVWQTVEEASGEDELPFHDAIYLTIVTISTVGYGDFSPNSLLAKVTICGMLAIVFVVVPLQVRESAQSMSRRPHRRVRAHSSRRDRLARP
jgi:hypothetical protein